MVARVADMANLPDWPRLLSPAQAAAYCGMTAESFRKHVQVEPQKFGSRALFDRFTLDDYLDRLYGRRRAAPAGDWVAERFGT